ncbi:hypothetical protein Tco_0417347 [Tanacetum coccineum]
MEGQSIKQRMQIQKFLRSLPFAWSQVSLIMRTKPGVDSLSFDDLYNNLRVFENDVKGSTASSSNTQNNAFVALDTSSTKCVSIRYSVPKLLVKTHIWNKLHQTTLLSINPVTPQMDHDDLNSVDNLIFRRNGLEMAKRP